MRCYRLVTTPLVTRLDQLVGGEVVIAGMGDMGGDTTLLYHQSTFMKLFADGTCHISWRRHLCVLWN
jgi:hypothetical protein